MCNRVRRPAADTPFRVWQIWQMDIDEGTKIFLSTKLDKTNPMLIYIGEYSTTSSEATFLVANPIQQEAVPCPQ